MAFPGVGTDGGASCPTGAQPLPERGGTLSGAEGCGTCCQEPQPTTAGAAFLPGLSQECKKPRPRPTPAPHRFFLAVADNNFSADGPSPRTLSFNLLLQHFYLAPDEIVVGVTSITP